MFILYQNILFIIRFSNCAYLCTYYQLCVYMIIIQFKYYVCLCCVRICVQISGNESLFLIQGRHNLGNRRIIRGLTDEVRPWTTRLPTNYYSTLRTANTVRACVFDGRSDIIHIIYCIESSDLCIMCVGVLVQQFVYYTYSDTLT